MSRSPVMSQTPPTWILAGPTACGKTAAALAIAERHPCEIISVDSEEMLSADGTAEKTVTFPRVTARCDGTCAVALDKSGV